MLKFGVLLSLNVFCLFKEVILFVFLNVLGIIFLVILVYKGFVIMMVGIVIIIL